MLSTYWHIYWHCFCTWSSSLPFNMINYLLNLSYLMLWYALIWRIWVFSHSRKTLLFAQYIFLEQEHIIFVGLFFNIFNTLPCSLKDNCDIWLYFTLTEAEFNGTETFLRTSTLLVKSQRSMATYKYQVSSRPITRGSGTWSNDYRL